VRIIVEPEALATSYFCRLRCDYRSNDRKQSLSSPRGQDKRFTRGSVVEIA